VAWLIATRAAFEFLGFKEKLSKAEGPDQEIEWVGVLLDAIKGKKFITADKKVKTLAKMNEFEAAWRGKAGQGPPEDEVMSIVGTLGFLCAAVRGGTTFLRRMWDALAAAEATRVPLTEDFWLDWDWWKAAITRSDGRTMDRRFARGYKIVHTWTDASGAGWGDTWKHGPGENERTSTSWKIVKGRSEGLNSSNWRELAAILRMVQRHAKEWAGRRILTATDNMTAQAAVNHGSVKGDPEEGDLMVLVRELQLLLAVYDIDLIARWVPGTDMITEGTDGLSRPKGAARPPLVLPDAYLEFWQRAFGHDAAETYRSSHDVGNPAGRNLCIDVPWTQLDNVFSALLRAKQEEPRFTGATVFAPTWPTASWRTALRYFELVDTVKAGTRLPVNSKGQHVRLAHDLGVYRMPREVEPHLSRRQRAVLPQLAAAARRGASVWPHSRRRRDLPLVWGERRTGQENTSRDATKAMQSKASLWTLVGLGGSGALTAIQEQQRHPRGRYRVDDNNPFQDILEPRVNDRLKSQNSNEFLVLSTELNEGPQVTSDVKEDSQNESRPPRGAGQPARQGRRAGAGRGLLPLLLQL
jgi:hypothetical protein